MKITCTGGTPEQNKIIEQIWDLKWPQIEPVYMEVFIETFKKELLTGIQTTQAEIEAGALEVLHRAGLVPRKL